MATGKSGSFTLTGTKGITVKVFWSEEYTVSTNRSVVSIDNIQVKSSMYSYVAYYLNGPVSVDGSAVVTFDSVLGTHNADMRGLNTYVDVAAASGYKAPPWKTGNITHNADGSKSVVIALNISGVTIGGGSGSGWKVTGSKTVSLTTIPRAATITSASDVTLGNACSVKWTPAAASFRYKLNFSLGNWSYTTPAIHPNKTSAYTYAGYVIPLDVANQIPNTRIGTMTVTLYTYSNSDATSQIGSTDSETFKVTVPDNIDTKPVVSMGLTPVSTLPSAFDGLYLLGVTKVKATLSAKGMFGADIDSYMMKVDGVFYYSDDEYTSGYLTTVGDRTVYGYATDKRGHIGEKLIPITVIAYSDPKLENASAMRCDQNGNITDDGTYLKINAKRTYSPVVSDGAQKNFCEIRYRYSDGVSYTPWVTILSRDSLTSDEITTGALLEGGLSTQSSYTVHLRAIDDVGRYADTFIIIPTAKVYWHRDGARNALGLGKYNERENAIDSDWDFYMNGHKVTGLPAPESDSDAVPKSYVDPADEKMQKSLNAPGWYKLGTISGEMCGVVTLTVGGVFVNNQASPSMVDIATQHNQARTFLRLPSLADSQISKIGLIKELTTVYGVYAYYNTTNTNTVKVIAHVHMGTFAPAGWTASNVSESNMITVMTLKA